MFEFFKAIKYMSSLETLEYQALKQDSLKVKSLFLIIIMIIGQVFFDNDLLFNQN